MKCNKKLAVVQYPVVLSVTGPFVMNTREEVEQAFQDYSAGKNGFENATSWKSSVYS